MFDVTAGGPGLVAVGENDNGAPVWTSTDGITWSQVPNDEAFVGEERIFEVTVGGPGLVAIGETDHDHFTPVMWTSRDGITWVVQHNAFPEGGGPRGVTAWGPGLVAFGSDGPDAAVWISLLDN
jgi:hypothetical protein